MAAPDERERRRAQWHRRMADPAKRRAHNERKKRNYRKKASSAKWRAEQTAKRLATRRARLADPNTPRCATDGCDGPVEAKGMCRSHYMRIWRQSEGGKRARAAAREKWASDPEHRARALARRRALYRSQKRDPQKLAKLRQRENAARAKKRVARDAARQAAIHASRTGLPVAGPAAPTETVGAAVAHPFLGVGEIAAVVDRRRVEVDFAGHGRLTVSLDVLDGA